MMPDSPQVRVLDEARGQNFVMLHGDCIEVARQLPDACLDHAIYSPPFSNLYCYSDSPRDMGNSSDDFQFLWHYRLLVREMYRLMRPGRLVAVHLKDLVNYKGRDGMAGLRDLSGAVIRLHKAAGFAWHSRIVIWTDPQMEARRSNPQGLLYSQLQRDSTYSRQGLPEYVLVFRRWPENEAEQALMVPVPQDKESFDLPQWREWASPVWMDINRTRVLNVEIARDDKDERHMCPLQLDVIERAVTLWSNPGDVVFSPFGGVGSEGVGSLQLGRRFLGVELKESYFKRAVQNLRAEEQGKQQALFPMRSAS